jgi:hypothetical protein
LNISKLKSIRDNEKCEIHGVGGVKPNRVVFYICKFLSVKVANFGGRRQGRWGVVENFKKGGFDRR